MQNKCYSQDITFCSNKNCKRESCERNQCHIKWAIKPYFSIADFEGTKYCPKRGADNG